MLFQSFLGVLKERLPDPTKVRSVQDLKSIGAEDDKSSAMDVDSENGNPKKSCEVGEREQWCLSTLGYLTAFTRQYASEVKIT